MLQGGKVFLVKNEVVGANAAIALKKNNLHPPAAAAAATDGIKKGSALCVHCTAKFTNPDDAVYHHNAESAKGSGGHASCCFCAFKANPAAANNGPATADVIRRHIRRHACFTVQCLSDFVIVLPISMEITKTDNACSKIRTAVIDCS